jgi:hydrogenase small subunit
MKLRSGLEPIVTSALSRRALLRISAWAVSALALPLHLAEAMAAELAKRRRSVIWLSFQECTGCTESLTRSFEPAVEKLLFDVLSLDHHHTLQAASGEAVEAARRAAMEANKGKYILVVDGSVPTKDGGVCSTIAGRTNLDMLQEAAKHAAAVVALGSCAAYGGIAGARPNPTGAVGVPGLVKGKPIVAIPGCPPMPEAIAATLAHLAAFGKAPPLDAQKRPLAFYGDTVHHECDRWEHYREGRFAERFDDEGARKGWCLLKLGCRGPDTHNACAARGWNGGISYPMQAGHPCIGCSERGFWDKGGIYAPQRRRGGHRWRGGSSGRDW